MAETKSASIRTPRARVKGLGASGHGAEHFWMQRLTGAANLLLMIAFAVIVAKMWGRPYPEAVALVAQPVVAIVLLLTIVSATIHMRLGMQVIIEDYVHGTGLKFAALTANTFYAVAVAAACLYAIVRVGLGGLV
ncbi:succinate dehydrogenase, hydrophobic membrane anchor protein [Methylobacterium brachythecii]|uniref:Succinate dehydrogenase hydrophobic membrane anchor subunit n=1 Tax=Methylobacterium brachythecii TaxID=1176177 RepID=A0A7W6AQM4_9HYPH|nr:succinate dehydrogenase, hydrophobic membrane anchor protein [Methylobacterium brachythecii]MBB3904936.1 succinate dehydrogenase / fumarate reductase membrane anchor subunit [Methylobacterium brachythecii]GLS46697.1 succinate dehydrogenase, hydrophobic membrane anchor protein [Methylobacterium brachythecii]